MIENLVDFRVLDQIHVLDKNKNIVKKGIIVKLTTTGCRVWQDQTDPPYTDSIQFAEWFPFQSSELSIKLINRPKLKPRK